MRRQRIHRSDRAYPPHAQKRTQVQGHKCARLDVESPLLATHVVFRRGKAPERRAVFGFEELPERDELEPPLPDEPLE